MNSTAFSEIVTLFQLLPNLRRNKMMNANIWKKLTLRLEGSPVLLKVWWFHWNTMDTNILKKLDWWSPSFEKTKPNTLVRYKLSNKTLQRQIVAFQSRKKLSHSLTKNKIWISYRRGPFLRNWFSNHFSEYKRLHTFP